MIRLHVLLWTAIAIALFAVAVILPRPAFATECVTVSDLMHSVQEGGGLVAGIVDVPAEGFDQVLIFALDGDLGMTYLREGCAIIGPMKIGVARDVAGA